MTDEEKNEVLAKWAGFTWDGFWIDPNGFTFGAPWPGPDEAIKESDWKVITGPDPLHSLDALDKWCFPKLRAIDLEQMFLSWVWMEERPRPPLAHHCAEAILSLIGEVKP